MAITALIGGESQHEHSEGLTFLGGAGLTYPSSPRQVLGKGGACCIRLAASASTYQTFRNVGNLPDAAGVRLSMKVSALPGGTVLNTPFVGRDSGGTFWFYTTLRADGKLDVYNQTDTLQGTTTVPIVAGQWFNIWVTWDRVGGNLKVYVRPDDGSAPGAAQVSISVSFPAMGWLEFGTGLWSATVDMDDVILFDSPASLPHQDAIVLLHKPISDNNRVGWYGAGTASTTNLFDGVNNLPPAGLPNDISTNASQIANFDHNATDVYDANVESYTTKGVGAADTVLAAVGVIEHMFNSSVAGRQDAVQVMSNPSIAEVVGDNNAQTGAGYPTGWNRLATGIAASPAGLAFGTSPVVRVRRVTPGATEANHSHCCFMALLSAVQVARVVPFQGWGIPI